jgi:hypothetical protein
LTEIGRFHWNQGEKVAHFAWFSEPWYIKATEGNLKMCPLWAVALYTGYNYSWTCLKGHLCKTKVCQWLVTGLWFCLGTLVPSTYKTDHHNIIKILLKVALNTITLTLTKNIMYFSIHTLHHCHYDIYHKCKPVQHNQMFRTFTDLFINITSFCNACIEEER